MNGYLRTLLPVLILSVSSMFGHAATFNVTTLSDTVGGASMSLRDALNAANADSENSTVVLGSGLTYNLTLCGTFEDANATGDLDHTEGFQLTIQGNGSTIQQTCADERTFHNHATGSSVLLDSVTITGGDVGLTDFGGGVWMVEGDLEINNSNIVNNEAGESGGGVQMDDGALTIVDSTFDGNESGLPGGGLEMSSLHPLVIIDSVFQNNEGDFGGAAAVGTAASVHIEGSSFLNNDATVGAALYLGNANDVYILESEFESNTGGSIIEYSDGQAPGLDLVRFVMERSTIADNNVAGGAALVVDTNGREARLINSTVSNNSGVGVHVQDEGLVETIHSTIVSNVGNNVLALGLTELRTFASIFADVQGGSDCGLGIGADSRGYNFAGDGTCGLGLGTGDVSFGGDPDLNPLAYYGGPTRVRQPEVGSEVLDMVPVAECTTELGLSPVDQRGVARPVGTGCDAGSYEGHGIPFWIPPFIILVADPLIPTPFEELLAEVLHRHGFPFSFVDDDTPSPELSSGRFALIIAPSATKEAASWKNAKAGMLVLDADLFDDFGLTKANRRCGNVTSQPVDKLIIKNPDSPLAAGFASEVLPFNQRVPYAFGKPARSAEVIAVLPGRRSKAAIFAYEQGARLINRETASDRRVGFFVTEENLAVLSQDGEALLVAALKWVAEASQR